MLIGYFIQKIDHKGRSALPAKLKRELGDKIILARWYESSVAIFSPVLWNQVLSDATAGSIITSMARDTERFLLGGAYEVDLDTQGRFVIPVDLRTYSGFKDEVVYVGLGTRVEVWDKAKWTRREKEIIENAEKLLEEAGKDR